MFTAFHLAFNKRFEKLAMAEVRSLVLEEYGPGNFPPGTYMFCESYCTEPNCDCQRVILSVYPDWTDYKEKIADVWLGWEMSEYHGNNVPEPALAVGVTAEAVPKYQHYERVVEALVIEFMSHDISYIERLKRHYNIVRDVVEGREPVLPDVLPKQTKKRSVHISEKMSETHQAQKTPVPRVGRNEPCPCGSGKKFKKCCGK